MITLKISDKTINAYEIDDDYTLLKRYVAELGKEPQKNKNITTLPDFLNFSKSPEKDMNNKVNDIRDELKKLSKDDLNVEKLLQLESEYPYIDRKTIGLLWLSINGYLSFSNQQFSKKYREQNLYSTFINISEDYKTPFTVFQELQRLKKESKDKWTRIVDDLKRENNIMKEIVDVKPSETTDFKLETTIEDIFLHLPNGESLYDIFDAFELSQELPFVMLVDDKKTYCKVFKDLSPSDEWIKPSNKPLVKGIHFYILDSSIDKLNNDRYTIDRLYSPGIWYEGNLIRLSLKLNAELTSEDMKNKLFQSVYDIDYEKRGLQQKGVRGKFSLLNVKFNRAVFDDMIFNNEILSHFLFINERDKSSLIKPRFSFYYSPNQKGNVQNSFTITLTPFIEEEYISIRISRAQNIEQVNNFINIFSRLYGIYLKNYDKVVNEYKELYNVDFDKFERKPKEAKENIKTGKRLERLRHYNSEVFGEGYARKCQRYAQPYVIKTKDLEETKNMLQKVPKIGEELAEYGVMNWPYNSDDWYVCYPREESDTDKRHIWPGFKRQSETAHNYDKYPLIPCCFTRNQYAKKKSNLNVYLEGIKEDEDEQFQETVFDRPLGSRKAVPPGRFAELPYYMQIVVNSAGYRPLEIKRKYFLPILRYGVLKSTDSMIHCLEKALYTRYSAMEVNEKRQHVKKVKENISKLNNFTIGRQEMYDIKDEEIREHLNTEGAYIDPDMYISILEKYYQCNIFLFQKDDESPDGEMIIPRHAIAYLPKKIDTTKRSIIIVKQGTKSEDETYPYQCELVVKYNKGRIEYFFENDELIKNIVKIRNEINTVYITSTTGKYRKYIPMVKNY